MRNGLMSKAGAGLGLGMAQVGAMGLHAQLQGDLERQRADITAKLEEVKQGYENQRAASNIQGQKDIHAASNQTQLDVAGINKASHLEGIGLMSQAKENKIDYKDGVVFKNGAIDEALTTQAGELSKKYGAEKVPELLRNMDGLVAKGVAPDLPSAFKMLHPDKDAGGLPKDLKDTDHRIQMYVGWVKDRMGADLLSKLEGKDRETYDQLLVDGADQIRNSTHPEVAFRKQTEAIDRLKYSVSGDGIDTNPAVLGARKKFQFGPQQ